MWSQYFSWFPPVGIFSGEREVSLLLLAGGAGAHSQQCHELYNLGDLGLEMNENSSQLVQRGEETWSCKFITELLLIVPPFRFV